MRKFAVFNRVVVETDDIYCIDFDSPLWFLEDDDGLIVSNKYGIAIQKNKDLTKETFYDMVKSKVLMKYVAGLLPEATAYSRNDWDKHCKEVLGIKDE